MPSNFPGPYEVEITYTVSGLEHVQRISCDVVTAPTAGDAPNLIDLVTKNASALDLDTAVTDWVNLIRAFMGTADTFDKYEFWKYTPGTFVRTWVSTGTLGIAGTSGTPAVLARQDTMTFRTAEGGIMKLVLLESGLAGLTRQSYASLSAGFQAIMDDVVKPAGWMLARDTSYPIAPLNLVGGQNETVFKTRYR